ncbi:hypothetical protein BKA70DRAFT_1264785 [Coprinopsis sp. MPI-PUGE-AT-0042]|nr:hypothetical protein BKA70DRAFT_1264785 [Coprinopsis sp. MPI-PUGE-AT-0042]
MTAEPYNQAWALAGSYVEVSLFTLTCVLLRAYYLAQRSYPSKRHNPMALRLAVGCAFFMSILGLFSACGVVYRGWPHRMMTLVNFFNAAIVQTFMTYRYWVLSRNRVISALLMALIATALGAGIAIFAKSFKSHSLDDRAKELFLVAFSLGSTAVVDLSITAVLLYKLWQTKTYSPNTRSIIGRIMRLAVVTGCAPSILIVASVVAFCVRPSTIISTSFAMPFTSVYTCTMIGTLNMRDYVRRGSSGSGYASSGTFIERASDTVSLRFRNSNVESPGEFKTPPNVTIKRESLQLRAPNDTGSDLEAGISSESEEAIPGRFPSQHSSRFLFDSSTHSPRPASCPY